VILHDAWVFVTVEWVWFGTVYNIVCFFKLQYFRNWFHFFHKI
jgi:hypothetical protein